MLTHYDDLVQYLTFGEYLDFPGLKDNHGAKGNDYTPVFHTTIGDEYAPITVYTSVDLVEEGVVDYGDPHIVHGFGSLGVFDLVYDAESDDWIVKENTAQWHPGLYMETDNHIVVEWNFDKPVKRIQKVMHKFKYGFFIPNVDNKGNYVVIIYNENHLDISSITTPDKVLQNLTRGRKLPFPKLEDSKKISKESQWEYKIETLHPNGEDLPAEVYTNANLFESGYMPLKEQANHIIGYGDLALFNKTWDEKREEWVVDESTPCWQPGFIFDDGEYGLTFPFRKNLTHVQLVKYGDRKGFFIEDMDGKNHWFLILYRVN